MTPENARLLVAALARIIEVIEIQASDEGLWFQAQTAPEAYLQRELRRLHEVIKVQLGELAGPPKHSA